MTLSFHALWMVSALGSAVFATTVATSPRGLRVLAAAFGLSAAWSLVFGPLNAEVIGVLAALAAAAQLVRPSWTVAPAVTGGVLAASWAALLAVEGVPVWGAVLAAAALLALTVSCARTRPDFAPSELRDEALTLMAALGLSAAALPGVSDGWRSALALSLEGPTGATEPIPMWTLAVGGSSIALGALYSIWSRR